MAVKNDILATAGVDLSAFEAGIAKLTSRLDAVEKAGNKAASGIDKVSKSTNSLKNIQIAQAYSSAIMEVATGAGVATNAVSNLSKSVGIGGDFALLKGFAAVSDIASHIPGQIGLIASGFNTVIDTVAKGIIIEKQWQDTARQGAFTQQSALEKEIALQKEVVEEASTGQAMVAHALGRVTQQEVMLDGLRKNNSETLTKQSDKEISAIEDKTAGSEARIAMLEIEKQKNQQISEVNSSLQKQFKGGAMDEGALKIRDSITSKINAEADAKKSSLKISEAQSIQELSLNNAIAGRTVTLGSQFDVITAQTTSQTEQLKVIEAQKHVDATAAAAKKVAINELKIAYSNLQYTSGRDLEQQKLITAQINAQAAGNKKLAALAQIRAQFELNIADAIRQGNDVKAMELAKQQAAAELGARAADIRKTPQERQAERKEQQAQGLAERTADARDKDIKARADAIRKSKRKDDPFLFNEKEGRFKTDDELLGRTDSTNHKSKADEKARQEFADRNEKRLLDAGKDAINRVNSFQAENFIAGKIMNAP
jgi:hypothetical protein